MIPVRRLIAAVYVKDLATHEDLILLPGESPPPEIAALVTNPDAWDAPPHDDGDGEPQPIAVGEPDPTGGTAEPDREQGEPDRGQAEPDRGQAEADGTVTKKAPSRRARSSAA